MRTSVIKQIQEQAGLVKQALKKFVPKKHEGELYGPEEEYTPQSLKAGIQAILADISGLVKAHNKFVQLSNLDERNTIRDRLTDISTYLDNSNYVDVAVQLDALKLIIRNYNVRGSSETQNALEERINQLSDKCGTIEENINTTERIKREAEQAEERIQTAQEKLASLDEMLVQTQEKLNQSTNLQNESQENYKTINELLTSSQSHEEVVRSFSQQAESRQRDIDQQKAMTADYEKKLKSYAEKREVEFKEAEKLIIQARDALGYTTGVGISAAINERYIEEKARGIMSLLWLAAAAILLAGGIYAGSLLLLTKETIDAGLLITRMTIMSAAFSATWFCAAQYIKHKNILEDYGYKTVLAKSIVAFLDLLTGEERERYLEMVLTEIHKDPLRKRHDVDNGIGQRVLNTIKKEKRTKDDTPNSEI